VYLTKDASASVNYAMLSKQVKALEGTTFLKSTVYSAFDEEVEGYDYAAVWYNGTDMGGFRFVMIVDDVIVNASCLDDPCGYPYLYIKGSHNKQPLLCVEMMDAFYNVLSEQTGE
jgi:hypothetical protein